MNTVLVALISMLLAWNQSVRRSCRRWSRAGVTLARTSAVSSANARMVASGSSSSKTRKRTSDTRANNGGAKWATLSDPVGWKDTAEASVMKLEVMLVGMVEAFDGCLTVGRKLELSRTAIRRAWETDGKAALISKRIITLGMPSLSRRRDAWSMSFKNCLLKGYRVSLPTTVSPSNSIKSDIRFWRLLYGPLRHVRCVYHMCKCCVRATLLGIQFGTRNDRPS